MNILFDGNYLFHKTFSVFQTYYQGQDMREVLADKNNRQILLRKCVIDMCHTINRFQNIDRVTFVIDSSSWRYNYYADYKYSLTRVKDDFYQQFLECLNEFERFLRNKGFIVSRVHGAEGDDLLFSWAFFFGYCLEEKTVIITGDSDIRQLITDNVCLFNNNSKSLKFYCLESQEVYWNEYFPTDIQVIPTVPFEVLLYKVIMGDTSDNIPKLKSGFGEKGFAKFLESIKPYKEPKDVPMISMAQWIASRFSEFIKIPEEQLLEKIIFNLHMTWLNLSTYNETAITIPLLKRMIKDVSAQKSSFSYKGKYTLEDIYGMIIK